MLPKGTFILGGAASGKSEWAENLVLGNNHQALYLATGRAGDDETAQKVKVHKSRRDARWSTIAFKAALPNTCIDRLRHHVAQQSYDGRL